MTDQNTAQGHERFMDVVAPIIADAKAAILVEPTEGPLHHPAVNAQSAAVFGAAFRQHRPDVALTELQPMPVRIVRAIALYLVRPTPGMTDLARHGRNGVHQRQQLRHIMPIGPRQDERERNALGVGKQVVFATQFPSIRGIRPRFRPPKTARTLALSATALDQSILSASCSRFSRTRRILSHAPAFCQSRNRRQQVIPDPQPISWGRYCHGMPVLSTNRLPVKAARGDTGRRPGKRNRRGFGGGRSGSIRFHRASSNSGLATGGPPCPSTASAKQRQLDQSFC